MALTDNGTTMLVQPTGYGSGGFGGFGDSGWWIILLFLCLGGGFGGGFGGNNVYPWMNQADITTSGFQNAALNTGIAGVQNAVTGGFGDTATALCGGFAGVNATVNGAANGISQQINSNQIADLERSFAAQTAVTQGMSALQSQLAQCCCDNRLATCQTQNLVSTESAATRSAIQTAVQNVLDKLCQQEIDALKSQNSSLQSQVLVQNLAASQTAQTAALIADNAAQTQLILNKLPATTA